MWSKTSFVRHVRNHYPVPPKEKWVCSVCGETSHSKQSIAQHYRTHQTSGSKSVTPLDHSPQPIGPNATISPSPQGHPCAHCEASFPSKTGLRNHVRARHQPQVSATFSREATTSKNIPPPPTRWSEEEVAKFMTAVNRYGLKQTTLIAQSVGLRTIQQVSYFKSRYKKLHPIWALKHLLQTTVQTKIKVPNPPHRCPQTAHPYGARRQTHPPSPGLRLSTIEEDTPTPSPDCPPVQKTASHYAFERHCKWVTRR